MNLEQTTEQPARELVQELINARYAGLTSRAVTDSANELVDDLLKHMEEREKEQHKRKNKRSGASRSKLRRALEALVGDLLCARTDENSGGWVYRSLKSNSFSGGDVSYRQFLAVVENIGALVEHKAGYQVWSERFEAGGSHLPLRGKASRFRATNALVDLARSHGVDPWDIHEHFIEALPQRPLVKNAGSKRNPNGTKVRGRSMKFERTGKALELERQVGELNQFIDRFDLRGGSHRGYVRVFNQGDHASFGWNKGGRLYSQGNNSYQRLSQDERLKMTINNQEVCEIDIRASYLTIYHAHFGAPLDNEGDPYALPGMPAEARSVVKRWFVATFGNNGHLKRWPRETAAEFRQEHRCELGKWYPVKHIREQAVLRFPLLDRWGTEDFGWADLMYLESQAVVGAMTELMGQGIPSLSVHDSLIVPVYEREAAKQVLIDHYLKATGAIPVLNVNYPLPSEPVTREDFVTFDTVDDLTEDNTDEENDGFADAGSHSEATSDDWDWPSDEKKEKPEEYPYRDNADDDSSGEHDPSLYA